MQIKSREEVINLIKTKPYKIGHALGFTDLNEINNIWLIEMLTSKEDETLQAHRNSYKTTCLSLAIPLLMVVKPNKRILFQRKTDAAVKEIIAQVKKILKSKIFLYIVKALYGPEAYIELTVDNATQLSTNLVTDTKGTVQLTGMGTKASVTGQHYDYIFTDDIITKEDRFSKAERERTITVYEELISLINRGGRIFNTGTPWHKEDAFKKMPPAKKYDWKSTGLISDELAEIKKSQLSNAIFAANYELRHVAEDDVLFANPQTGAEFAKCKGGYTHVDAAYNGSDWTAFTAIKEHDGIYYVFGKCWRKHVDDVMDDIVKWNEETISLKLYIEKNGDKGYVAKEFRNKGLKVRAYDETQNKHMKILTYLKFNWPKVVFVAGTDEKYIEWIEEYNDTVEHDDCPDSLASIIRVLRPQKKKRTNDAEFNPLLN